MGVIGLGGRGAGLVRLVLRNMDRVEVEKFFECLEKGTEMPIDVYDMASWMAITPLSEQSIQTGKSVEIPDLRVENTRWKRDEFNRDYSTISN